MNSNRVSLVLNFIVLMLMTHFGRQIHIYGFLMTRLLKFKFILQRFLTVSNGLLQFSGLLLYLGFNIFIAPEYICKISLLAELLKEKKR